MLLASFLIFLTYKECMQGRNSSLISYSDTNDKIFDYIKIKDVLDVLKDKTGILVIINDKKDTNRFIDLLYSKELKENIYVCNVKNDEVVLSLENDKVKVKQKPSQDYKNLLNRFGAYSEDYYLIDDDENIIETNYKRIITPMVLFVKNGKILFSHFVNDQETTDEELLAIYSKGFSLLNN